MARQQRRIEIEKGFQFQMRSPLRIAVVVALAFSAFACARTVMPVASPDDAQRAAKAWPGTTHADLEQGRKLYISRCSGCHQPVHPADVAPDKWPGELREMSARAKLDDMQTAQVERYLVTMAEAARRQKTAARN